ncbi:MAG: Cof-type HAD-IIB family hydrolase [Clostridiales bacterium]|nr:Cof-type HAD-IIB family hydrolase [Clostridiales bacterium]
MNQVKAIMLDMDGTFMGDHVDVLPYTVEMLYKMKEKGVLIGISTGRDVMNVVDLCRKWEIEDLIDIIVGSGGAELYDRILGTKIYQYPLAGEHILKVIHHYEDMDVNFAIPHNGVLYAPKDDDKLKDLAQADGMPYKIVDFNEFCAEPKAKVMIVCYAADMPKIVERSKSFSDPNFKSASLITSRRLYEYMDPRVSKTNGIVQAMKEHNIGLENICAFGDADNDYDMVLNCGIGVAMGNGSEKTKSAADYITDDNTHDGIGNFIAKYLLQD